ncbi:MAG: HU family DNA-binding protein [Candidatus Zeuxoniibacter abyssi]|nr:MAG: HU family DNA-binding protein [Candidatus Persebacteraceae bacterium AB1(2)]
MNKKELIDSISANAALSKADAGRALDAFVELVIKTLRKKELVIVVGFGSFTVQKRKARTGRNPQTGEAIKIKAQTAPKFRPGKALKEALNKKK